MSSIISSEMAILTLAGVALTTCVMYHFSSSKEIAHFPKVPLHRSVLGMLKKLPFDDVLKYTGQIDLLHQYKLVRAYFQGQWTLMVGCPKMALDIYKDTETFPKLVPEKDQPGSVFAKLTGHSAFFSNATEWRHHRRTLLDATAFTSYVSQKTTLTQDALSSIMADLVNKTKGLNGGRTDVLDLMQRTAFDCLSKQFLNKNFGLINGKATSELPNAMLHLFDNAFTYGFTLMTILFPSLQSSSNPFYRKVYDDISNWENCLQQVIRATRKTIEIEGIPKEGDRDLVTKMILASNADATYTEKENDEAILNNLKILFLPSQSLPPALCASLHYLAQDKEIQEKAHQEIRQVVGNSKSGSALTESQIHQLPYLSACIKETLRLYPTLCPPPKRIVSRDILLQGQLVPKGTHLMIDMFSIQRNPSLWTNPTKFDPTRFLKGDKAYDQGFSSVERGYMPFSAGARRCPGSQMVHHLMLNTLANLLQNFKIRYPQSSNGPNETSQFQLKLKAQIILIPDNLELEFVSRH